MSMFLDAVSNSGFSQRLDWKSWKMKMVMNFALMSHANFINFAPGFYQVCAIFADIEKFSINLEIPHFPTFSTKCRKCKI